ncbi:DUF3265 domain-containing protein [Vibrio parahaemolyticus]|nr:DUF3265 domain-containing protein [Vibrio parahaemolyticus]HCH4005083.1 DUF3265 domain-containing protein [Vibrio parahaemolyticus]
MLYFNVLACTKGLKGSVLTNSSSGIHNAWHFYYALVLVFKAVCSSIGIALFTP